MKYYVYAHKIKNTDIIFYIGSNWQGGNPERAYETKNRPKKWHEVVAEHNGAFDVEIIGRYYNDRRAYECEMILMAYYQDKHNWCWCNGERKDEKFKARARGASISRQIMATKGKKKIVFESVRYASQQLNIKRPTIQRYLKTGKIHSSGFTFKYVDTKR
ncbi:NUMOD1 domain-containing DNA-binding protein [Priestia flexa]|uniref:NUMOD1 domain-containing DNA-binding protein n=1 Tax=Priestia flexa TaxID=86664 RepID=UPI00240E15C3|nr:NUMOD1 domain-containing DNA-binding protein [Priestia flexa]WEZ08125.1 NUMOD1 domain-containing DNA-binding protein [Priestia flexa]